MSALDEEACADVPFSTVICATCGRDNPSHLVFCQECGQKLAPRVAAPTPPVGIVPPAALRGIGGNGAAANPFGATAASPAMSPYSALATTASPPVPVNTNSGVSAFAATGLVGERGLAGERGLGGAAGLEATASIPQAPAGRPSAPDFSFVPRAAPPAAQPSPSVSSVHMQSTKVSCPRCQASNDVGMRFCVACGGLMDARAPQSAQSGQPTSAPASIPITTRAPISSAEPPSAALPSSPIPSSGAVISPARVVSVAAAPPTETIRVCARCRGACDATAQFCRFCGASLGESPVIPSAAFPSSALAPSTPANHASGLRPSTSAAASPSPAAPAVASKTDPIPPPVSAGRPAESMASAALASLHQQATRDSSIDAHAPYTERDLRASHRDDERDDVEPMTRDAQRDGRTRGDALLLHPRPFGSENESPVFAATTTSVESARLESARAAALRDTSMLHGGIAPVSSQPEAHLSPRARLVVIAKDGGEGASYPIGESMDIGRTEGNIAIAEDRYLSPRHARIVRRASDGRLVLRDLGSTNGIYLRLRTARATGAPNATSQADLAPRLTSNGPLAIPGAASPGTSQTRDLLANPPIGAMIGAVSGAVSSRASSPPDLMNSGRNGERNADGADGGARVMEGTHRLVDQDLFLVGQQVLRFEVVSDARGEDGLGSASEHGTLLFGTPAAPRYARLSQRTVEGVSRDVFYVRKAETVLGRESGDIVFTEDPFLSRRHALIRVEVDARQQPLFLLADLGSSNGTFIHLRGEVPLQTGDQFRIGQQLFRIDIA